jgi:cytochrome P450
MIFDLTWYQLGAAVIGLPVIILIVEYINELRYVRKNKALGCEPPSSFGAFPLGIPVLVKFFKAHMDSNLNQFCREKFDDFGVRTVRVQTLTRKLTATIDPENLKAILATQFKEFDLGLRYYQFQPLMGDGIFTLSGSGWYHSRALLRPHFTTEEVSQLQNLEDHSQVLLDLLRQKSTDPASSGVFDIQELFFRLTIDTATEMLFGESTESLSGGRKMTGSQFSAADEFAKAFNTGQNWLLYRAMAQRLYNLVTSKEYKDSTKICHSFVDYYVQRALTAAEKGEDEYDDQGRKKYYFLKELTKETRDPVLMRDQALNILLAGRDTTAGTLSFTFALLLRNKRVFHKLREAILQEFGTGTENISFQSLKRCEYLKHVINEVLRLYPQVPLNFRTANKDTTLPRGGGPDQSKPVFIKKGTAVFYATYSLQRDKEFWGEDANEFVPERWENHKFSAWRYIPFNGGPRICLGQQFALTEIAYAITRVLQNFKDIETTPEFLTGPIKECNTLTLGVSGGVPINLTPA